MLFPSGIGIGKPDYLALGWMAISVVALHQFRVNMVVWIGVSAGVGIGWFLL